VAQVRRWTPGNYRRVQGSSAGLQTGWVRKLLPIEIEWLPWRCDPQGNKRSGIRKFNTDVTAI
jgi:hypothetical protein